MFNWLSNVKNSLYSVEDVPWEYTEEPHTSRRKEILKKYPEIRALMGYDSSITYIVLAEVFIQFCMMWLARDMAWGPLFIVSYVVSGTINHSLVYAIHEIGHNMAYGHKHPLWNRALGMICDLPLGVPISVIFKKTHSGHHHFLCDLSRDISIPSPIENWLISHPITRILWIITLPLFLAIRPLNRESLPLQKLQVVNAMVQIAFNAAVLHYLGPKSLLYSLGGTFLGLGPNPLIGHSISDHYMFTDGLATSSYYGPLNLIIFNSGYHVEHHDFPYIPWHRLPQLRRIAPEFYNNLPYHTSCFLVFWKFIITGPQAGFIPDMATMNKKTQGH